MRKDQVSLVKEVKRLQSLCKAQAEDDRALKNDMRRIMAMLSLNTSPTEVSVSYHMQYTPTEVLDGRGKSFSES